MFRSYRLALAAIVVIRTCLPAAADDWNSCHAGINLGAARAQSEATDLPYSHGPYAGLSAWNASGDSVEADGRNLSVGLSLGCDRQVAQLGGGALVFGGVVEITRLNADGKAAFAGAGSDTVAAVELNSAANLRLRGGFAKDDRLFYLTGGLARGDIRVSASDQTAPAMMQVSQQSDKSGWVIGAGVEWQIADNRTLDASLLHYDFGTVTASGEASDPAGAYPRFENDVTADVLSIGMNWRF